MKHNVLVHEHIDDVGVAVVDLKKGDEASAVTLEGQPVCVVTVMEEVPLGHKIALKAMAEGAPVIEYGRPIGKTLSAIGVGMHVHVHNIKSRRW
jgi:(2R)-sulfolactate sulfo-lyase subunit alpha